MKRLPAHIVETKSKDLIRKMIDDNDAIYRDISERDYGIDGLVELFENGNPTGKIAFLQIKGTQKLITPLKNKPVISCKISQSTLDYIYQDNIPILLLFISLELSDMMYYLELQTIRTNIKENIKNTTVHIPQENLISGGEITPIVEIINRYFLK